MSNFPLIIDVFEGSGLLDLQKLKDNNIKYVIVRLGCYSKLGGIAGNRKDSLFDQQWAALDADPFFIKGVYIPYNPWRNWQYNLQWAIDNVPSNCKMIEMDVENARTYLYSSKSYAADYSACLSALSKLFNTITYTGYGYLSYLSSWPKGDYSWAQYPYALRPSDTLRLTWDALRELLSRFIGPSNANRCPGVVKMWQFTGDKLVLDGSDKGLDIYAWLGTQEELDALFGTNSIPNPNPQPQPSTGSVYLFKNRTHKSSLGIEPATIQGAYTPKTAKQVTSLNQSWQNYILALNNGNQKIFDKIADPIWGPSIGIKGGKLQLISLGYWLNQVKVLEIVTGLDGNQWVRVASLGENDNPPLLSDVNFQKTPWLIQHVTMESKSNQLIGTGVFVTDNAYVPLVSEVANQLYFPLNILGQSIKINRNINVRQTPSTKSAIVKVLSANTSVLLQSVQLGENGVWGYLGDGSGWIAMRYNGILYGDWVV